MASTSISSKSVPLYSIFLRGTDSICSASSSTPLRPCVSMKPMATSSPRLCRRNASLNILKVFPTPGAYPRKSLKAPRAFSGGEATSSHSSGFFGTAISARIWSRGLECNDAEISRRAHCGSGSVACGRRRYHCFLSSRSARKPDDRRIVFSAGHFSSFRRVGNGRIGVHVRCGDAVVQLFLLAPGRNVHGYGPAKLGGTVGFPADIDHRKPAFIAHPQRSG